MTLETTEFGKISALQISETKNEQITLNTLIQFIDTGERSLFQTGLFITYETAIRSDHISRINNLPLIVTEEDNSIIVEPYVTDERQEVFFLINEKTYRIYVPEERKDQDISNADYWKRLLEHAQNSISNPNILSETSYVVPKSFSSGDDIYIKQVNTLDFFDALNRELELI